MRASLAVLLILLSIACTEAGEARRARNRAGTGGSPSSTPVKSGEATRAVPRPSSLLPQDPRVTTPEATAEELAAERMIGPANAIGAFGFELWRELGSPRGNRVVSPASIALALAMTHPGARGETAAEIARVLHLDQAGERPHEAFGALLARWRGLGGTGRGGTGRGGTGRGGVELAVANRLFGERTLALDPRYGEIARRHFGAPLESVDFRASPEAARALVNRWVERETRNRIRDLLPPPAITSETRLVLANAIYFEGRWQHAFDASRTQPLEFHLDAERTVRVPTMQRTGNDVHVAVTDGVRLVQLPYAGEDLAMVVIVPEDVDGLAAVERRLDAATYRRWIAALRRGRADIRIPRFDVDPETMDLRDPLRALGLRAAWEASADFSGIAPPPPSISIGGAYHRAIVEVDEEGTIAAGATAVVQEIGGMPEPPTLVHADRPFLWTIRDVRTGAILFLGRVTDPRQN